MFHDAPASRIDLLCFLSWTVKCICNMYFIGYRMCLFPGEFEVLVS